MARLFTILLISVYAFSATGATIHLHYCCGKLQKLVVQNQQADHDDCPLCLTHQEKEKNTDCCTGDSCDPDQASHDHCQNIKVDAKKTTEDHLPSGDKNLAKIYPLELFVFTLINSIDFPLAIHYAIPTATDSPPHAAVPLFIQHCTYRI